MDDVVASNSLYEEDFYAWTQAQAALLREGRLGEADIENILEEIDSLGRMQVAELRSRMKELARHLLNEIYVPEMASHSSATAILTLRQDVEFLIEGSPSLVARSPELFADAYASARKVTAVETGISLETFPTEPPFTYEQLVDEDFWPGRPMEGRARRLPNSSKERQESLDRVFGRHEHRLPAFRIFRTRVDKRAILQSVASHQPRLIPRNHEASSSSQLTQTLDQLGHRQSPSPLSRTPAACASPARPAS